MKISTFELLFKELSPQSPLSGTQELPVSLALQGYFLAISNLEDETYQYRLEFITGTPGEDSPDLENRVFFIFDANGTDNQFTTLTETATSNIFVPNTASRRISIPAHSTALVAVIPAVFDTDMNPSTVTPTDISLNRNFEVRGYVEISLPVLTTFDQFGRIIVEAQSDDPVRVGLTPQHRTTFYTSGGDVSGENQTSLPLINCDVCTTIEPDQPFFIGVGDKEIGLEQTTLQRLADYQQLIPAEQRASALALLMAQLGDDIDLETFNKQLAERGISFGLQRNPQTPDEKGTIK